MKTSPVAAVERDDLARIHAARRAHEACCA
jgi:hypothetical protein